MPSPTIQVNTRKRQTDRAHSRYTETVCTPDNSSECPEAFNSSFAVLTGILRLLGALWVVLKSRVKSAARLLSAATAVNNLLFVLGQDSWPT